MRNHKANQTPNQLHSKRGQNTAEYIILLVLVAVGSIGVFQLFGDATKRQIGGAVAALTGQADKYDTATNKLGDIGGKASERAVKAATMQGVEKADLEKFQ